MSAEMELSLRERIRLNLVSAMNRASMTQVQLADALNISKGTVNNWIRGNNSPDVDMVPRICKVLDITITDLYSPTSGESPEPPRNTPLPANILPLPNFVKKPRLGTIACGKPILCVEDADEFDDVPDTVACDFTLRCQGDSMINARIFDGDIVYIRAQPQVENGQIAAVRIGEEATLKKVYYTGMRVTLRACNPLYPDLEYEGAQLDEIAILGRAVAFTSIIRQP